MPNGVLIAPALRDQLLATKLIIPPRRANRLSRPHLLELLNAGLEGKLTLISAPPGFGKTSILSEWSASLLAEGVPVAWISLDKADKDPSRFLSHLSAALQNISPSAHQVLRSFLNSPHSPPIHSILTILINSLSAVERRFVLILDDYHSIEAEEVHQSLNFILEHQPPALHIVIASRVDPPLPLATLRVKGLLNELRTPDLRFSLAEANNFLSRVAGLKLADDDVAALESQTEGWVAGLQLAALAAKGRDDVSAYIASFSGSHRHVLDYLAEEVLLRQPPEVQTFLLETSLLTRFNAAVCAAITELPNCQTRLERLEKDNLFLLSLDDRREWYRYHALFGDFLRAYLHTSQPKRLQQLHRRAAIWFEQNDMTAEALEHYLAANDGEAATRLVEKAGQELLAANEMFTLRDWLGRLPAENVAASPRLLLYQAWLYLMHNRLDEAVAKADTAERLGQGQAEAAVIRTALAAVRHELGETIRQARRVLKNLPAEELFLRGVTLWNLAYALHMSGHLGEAQVAYREAFGIGQVSNNMMISLTTLGGLGFVLALQGQMDEAARIYKQAIELGTQDSEIPPPLTSLAYMSLGTLYYEWNDLPTARKYLQKAMELSEPAHLILILLEAHIVLAQVEQAKGQSAAALQVLDRAEQIARRYDLFRFLPYLAAWRARFHLQQPNHEAAIKWAQQCGIDPSQPPQFAQLDEYYSLALVWLAQNKISELLMLLEQMANSAQTFNWRLILIRVRLLEALAYRAQGQREKAFEFLAEALKLAQPCGYRRLPIDVGQGVGVLLHELVAAAAAKKSVPDFPADYAAQLLELFDLPAQKSAAGTISVLSKREIEVLRLVAAGQSNREIATELTVAASTVKTHVDKILQKLNVNTRTQAVAEAIRLKLLAEE